MRQVFTWANFLVPYQKAVRIAGAARYLVGGSGSSNSGTELVIYRSTLALRRED